jgi:hypothetical protein
VRSCRWERQDPRVVMYRCGRGGGEAWMRASGRMVEGSCARISGTLEGKERNYFFITKGKEIGYRRLMRVKKNSVSDGNRTINTRCKNWIRWFKKNRSVRQIRTRDLLDVLDLILT